MFSEKNLLETKLVVEMSWSVSLTGIVIRCPMSDGGRLRTLGIRIGFGLGVAKAVSTNSSACCLKTSPIRRNSLNHQELSWDKSRTEQVP